MGKPEPQDRMIDSVGKAPNAELRRAVYLILIVTSLGACLGRLATVKTHHLQRVRETASDGTTSERIVTVWTPLLSANDRSRWSMIRALGDQGTYVIDGVIFEPGSRNRRDHRWYSIDMVRHRGRDGREHYYSSKPPLMPTVMAGQYWLLKKITGGNLKDHTFYMVRVLLVLNNLLPLLLFFSLLAMLVERYGQSDWGRMFVMGAATWGTFLTTFSVTLNNHLHAAICVLIALVAALPVWLDGRKDPWRFAVAGGFAALAATNELPALSFLCLLGAAMLWKAPLRTLAIGVPAVLLVAVAFFGVNQGAHQSWRPPYMHRSDGERVAFIPSEGEQTLEAGDVPEWLRQGLRPAGWDIAPSALLLASAEPDRWVLWDRDGHDRLAVRRRDGGVDVLRWDNWYEYDNSYWQEARKQGVDRGEDSRGWYAFHMLIGHYGVFSLTPIWIGAVLGAGLVLGRRRDPLWGVAAMATLLTLVCVAFYIARPLEDRNYGGVACGFRWLFWLIPLWLLVLIRGADWLGAHRPGRIAALLALGVSAFSAAFAAFNPWTHSWLYQYWSYLGWLSDSP